MVNRNKTYKNCSKRLNRITRRVSGGAKSKSKSKSKTNVKTKLKTLSDVKDFLGKSQEDIDRIEEIDVFGKNITQLPDLSKFQNMKTLNISYNNLTELPNLPNRLVTLRCNKNQLSQLPRLPSTLESLSCFHNQLSVLPDLPDGLTELICNHNQLSKLPKLPSTLEHLVCNHNQLSQLPRLPSTLKTLECNNNQLSQLPDLPNTLITLQYVNNPIYDILQNTNIGFVKQKVHAMNAIRDWSHAYKYKEQFRDWLWKDVRERKTASKYHPDNLEALINENPSLEIDEIITKLDESTKQADWEKN